MITLKVDTKARECYPSLRVAIMEARFAEKLEFNEDITRLKIKLEKTIREKYKNPETLPNIIKYNSFYKKFKSKVPMEFQIRSIINNKEIPTIHPVLTCLFMAELKNMILTAGHDRDKLGDTIEVLKSKGTEEYTKLDEKIQKLKPDDLFATDGTRIISSVLYGPDSKTKITEKTQNFLFMCYAFDIDDDEITRHMSDIFKYINVLIGKGIESFRSKEES